MATRSGLGFDAWRLPFAAGLAGLGALSLAYGDFALRWQPMPAAIPWHDGLALLSGGLLVAGGVGLCVPLITQGAAWLLAGCLVVFWVVPQVFALAASPQSLALWLGVFETIGVSVGAWLVLAGTEWPGLLRWCSRSFGAACLVFGLSHVVYANFTAQMIPPWLPLRTPLAYATGVAHMAAGLALLISIMPALAALLEAIMMTAFLLLVHLPGIGAVPAPDWAPSDRIQLTAFFWTLSLTGSAWILAGTHAGFARRGSSQAGSPRR